MQGGMRTGNSRGHLGIVVGLIPLAAKAKQQLSDLLVGPVRAPAVMQENALMIATRPLKGQLLVVPSMVASHAVHGIIGPADSRTTTRFFRGQGSTFTHQGLRYT
jgi:hypothetical protein